MLLGMCLICVTCLGWAVAAVVARPADDDSRRRDLDRRSRLVDRHPERVNHVDVGNLLRAESIPADTVDRVLRRASERHLGARTMWRWAHAHGPDKVVLVVDAGVAEDSLLDHLDAGTAPDWRSLEVFAGLANDRLPGGMPLDELVDLDAVPQVDELMFPGDLDDWTTTVRPEELSRFESLPPIAEPGLQPFAPIVWVTDDGGGDWSAVA